MSVSKTDIVYTADELPRRPQRPVEDLYAYEPDRESPERLRIMELPAPAPRTYLSEGREREQRTQAPRRQVSLTSPS